MSLGTILLIILVIALLGGFSGFGGGPFYGSCILWRRWAWSCNRCRVVPCVAWQALRSTKRKTTGKIMMKIRKLLVSASMMGVIFLASSVSAQGVKQTVPIAKVDVQTVAAG